MRGCDALLPPPIYHPPPLSVIVSRDITAAHCRAASCILHAVQILINKMGLTDTNYPTGKIIYEAEPLSHSGEKRSSPGLAWSGPVWSVVSKISNFPAGDVLGL